MPVGLAVPVRIETFLAVHRQRLPRWEVAVGNPELRAFVCAALGRSPRRHSAPAICAALPRHHVLQVAAASTCVSDPGSAHASRTGAIGPHDHIAGLRRERDAARWS
jgi:hypothetical protein